MWNLSWLTQKMMATLYDVGLPTINEHIKKIYADSELEESATIRNFRIVQTEGSRQVTRDTNIAFIMAKHADASIPDTPEEWLDQFNTFSMYTVRPFDGRLRTAVD